MTGAPDTNAFWGISGERLLHLNIWYDAAIEDDIKVLIQELQALPKAGVGEARSSE